jgi:acetyl-CoA synthetase
MTKLTGYTSYADAQGHCTSGRLWELFDGDREQMNIAHECIDRHAAGGGTAVILVRTAGADEVLGFQQLSDASSRFAHYLVSRGIKQGDRVAVMLEPSLAFYAAMFGAMKMGAIAVPLFTLFGPDGIRLRVQDCQPAMVVTNAEKAPLVSASDALEVVVADDRFLDGLGSYPTRFDVRTRADDLAIFQYTSGTTRELPDAVRHTHRALVTLMLAALYGTGVRPGDRFMCPSSPAWGHGLWHGTLAPLALGVTIGAYAGKFNAERLLQALQDHRFNNISAAATHYRMMRTSGAASRYRYEIEKASFTGEPIDSETSEFVEATFGCPVCSMYGTTEIGVILVSYPGARDFVVKPGSLGKPIPGLQGRGPRSRGQAVPAGRDGRTQALAPRRVGRHQGPRPHRRGRLLLPWRPRRRRHHLRRLDDQCGRDRGRRAQAPRRARGRRDRRARRAARPGRQGLRGGATAMATSPSPRKSRTSCASASASTNIRASSRSWPELPKTPAGKKAARAGTRAQRCSSPT